MRNLSPDTAAIRAWLIDRISTQLGTGHEEIDANAPFTSFGLSSKDGVVLSGELMEWLGRDVSPTLVYEYPTIDAVARYLGNGPAPRPPDVPAGASQEPIAIVGIGCRFPGARGPAEFWDLLREGKDAITRAARPAMNRQWGGFIDHINCFDADFFGISRREAIHMDPQQRLLLEAAWEALEDAGRVPESLSRSGTGVFIGISNSDYGRMVARQGTVPDLYWGTGNALSIAANRLSYFFNFQGPSMSVDTACSSSLTAVHLACRSIWSGESTMALAGGVNLILSPEVTLSFSHAGFLSPEGRCRAFDEAGNGYVRGEGVGLVVLVPLSLAMANRDPIYALVLGSAVSQDGRSNGLTAPNPGAQEAVLRAAYSRARVSPGNIQYVETHGTGTPLGDPIEVKALGRVLAEERKDGPPCAIGSVKTNIGHLEAAAGIAGLIKVALALKHKSIPPSLHFKNPSPHIPFDRLPVAVQKSLEPWPESKYGRLAGVSSFGFGGTNCHVVLKGPPDSPPMTRKDSQSGPRAELITLSARSPEGLRQAAADCRNFLVKSHSLTIEDLCYTTELRRSHHDHRLAVAARSPEELRQSLDGFLRGEPGDVVTGTRAENPGKLAFVFSGQGTQWPGMCFDLLEQEPAFRDALSACDESFRRYANWSLVGELRAPRDSSRLAETEFAQPCLCAVQIALAALWKSWGIVPQAVAGHSAGELAAACVAGVLSVEQAMLVAYHRGCALRSAAGNGGMAALRLSAPDAGRLFAKYEIRGVSIAAVNGPSSTVVAGDQPALAELVRRAEEEGFTGQVLDVDFAAHTPRMERFAEDLARRLDGFQPQTGSVPIYSSLSGTRAKEADFSAGYWGRNVLEPVRFAAAIDALVTDGYRTFLELGPHPALCDAIHQCLEQRGQSGIAIPSIRRGRDARATLLESLGRLYVDGWPVEWASVCGAQGKFVRLPSYPWHQEALWIEDGDSSPILSAAGGHPLLGRALQDCSHQPGAHLWETELNPDLFPWLAEHAMHGVPVLPASAYMELALAAAREIFGGQACVLSELVFHQLLAIPERFARRIRVVVSASGADHAIQIYSRPGGQGEQSVVWELHASGKIRRGRAATARDCDSSRGGAIDFSLMFFAASEQADRKDKYRLVLEAARFADNHGFAAISVPERHFTSFGSLYPNPAVLHAALARETSRVRLRAGSVVLPLHNPIRVAEEWAMVDNLSGGRVELSFASGWHPNDFALAPEKYHDRRVEMLNGIRMVQDLWRGKAITATSGSGAAVELRTYPAPIQAELPVWITASGNPETFAMAGELGANLLTHLLDQDVEMLAARISAYRESRRNHGHDPAAGRVSVMLHTFVGEELETVRGQVRKPYCEYLKTILYLFQGLSYSRGRTVDLETMSEREREEATGALFDRFFTSRSLLGDKSSCKSLVERMQAIGVNDISCLLDFGVDTDLVLASLPRLAELKDECAGGARASVSTPTGLRQDSFEAVHSRCTEVFSGSEFYRLVRNRGLREGPSFRVIEKIRRRDGEALAELRPDGAIEDQAGSFEFHPALLGACLDSLLAALPRDGATTGAQALWLPVGVDRFTVHHSMAGVRTLWSHARLEPAGSDGCFSGDIQILGPEGAVLAEAEGVKLRRLEQKSIPAADSMDGLFYEVQWRPMESVSNAGAPAVQPGRWIILADRNGLAQSLAVLLERQGHSCTLVSYKEGPETVGGPYCLDLRDPQAMGSLLESIIVESGSPVRAVVHLWGLDAADDETLQSLEHSQSLGTEAALHVIHALARSHAAPGPRVWLVSRGAQPAGADTGSIAAHQSPIWGLGRTCSIELPELWGGLIDLDPRASPESSAAHLRDILCGQGVEDQIAIRGGRRFSPRLVPGTKMTGQRVSIVPDGAYLITGGHDGVGLALARWLVNKGAGKVVLAGRRPMDRKETRVALESLGSDASVDYFQADVADEEAMNRLFAEIATGPQLRGIFHCASVWTDPNGNSLVRPLLHLDAEAIRQVFRPKLAGSALLDRHLRHTNYDFMVFFSSAAAVCGSPGQGNYAAAGAFLDSLANHLRGEGKPVTSVNWGPISGAGFGTTRVGQRVHEFLEDRGVYRISVEQTLDALDRILGDGIAQIGVMRIDGPALGNAIPQIARAPWARELFRQQWATVKDCVSDAHTALRLALLSKADGERRDAIRAYLSAVVARSLRLPAARLDANQKLSRLGLDSLVALELRNRIRADLRIDVSMVRFLQDPSIGDLAAYIFDQVGSGDQAASQSGSGGQPA